MASDRIERYGPAIVLVALVAAIYGRALSYELVWDDGSLVNYVKQLYAQGGFLKILSSPFLVPSGFPSTENTPGYFRPVILTSIFVDSALAVSFPSIFHLTNIFLHAAVTVLVLRIGSLVSDSRWTAFWCAALFAVHPVHVESVAFVSGRTDLWASLFVFLTCLAWLRVRMRVSKKPFLDRLWGGAAFMLALLSKEVAIFVPVVLLAWDRCMSPANWRDWWARNRAWMASWSASLTALLMVRWGMSIHVPISGGEGGVGAGSLGGILGRYSLLLLFPRDLNAYYIADQVSPTMWTWMAAVLLMGIFVAAGVRSRNQIGLLGLLWTAGFLVPVSGVVPLIGTVIAERYLYLPSFGACLASAALLGSARSLSRFRPLPLLGPGLLVVALAATAFLRVPIWRDSYSFFSNLVQTSPRNWISHYGLGVVLAEQGRYGEAVEAYRTALRLEPDSLVAQHNLGAAYRSMGRLPEAVGAFTRATEIAPNEPGEWLNLGLSLGSSGRLHEALPALREAVRLAPLDPKARYALGLLLVTLGSRAEAWEQYRALLPLNNEQALALRSRIGERFPR